MDNYFFHRRRLLRPPLGIEFVVSGTFYKLLLIDPRDREGKSLADRCIFSGENNMFEDYEFVHPPSASSRAYSMQ